MADKTKRAKAKTPKESTGNAEKRAAKPSAVDAKEAQAARNRARERSGSED